MKQLLAICMFTVLCRSASVAGSPGLVLFEDGRAHLEIVTAQAATDAEKDAARELKRFLDRASGASFEITTETPSSTGVFVGRTQRAAQWGLPSAPPTPEQDEGVVIEVRGDAQSIVLVGTIDMGTKFAVYDFLDRFLGVRWFLPGRLFEVVPRHDRLVLNDCGIRELPALSGRKMGGAIGIQRSADEADPQFGTPYLDYSDPKGVRVDTSRRDSVAARWGVRNLQSVDGRLSDAFHGHHMGRIFTGYWFREHPEYFPERYRVEGARPPVGAAGWQPCTSEPGTVEVALDWGRDFYRKNPHHWAWFSLGINDGGGWCNCDRCLALDEPRGSFRNFPVRTDRFLKFVRQVAEPMHDEFPGRKICLLLYSTLFLPPADMQKLPPNVVGVITRDAFQYHDPAYLEQDLEQDRAWLEVLNGQLYRYDYLHFGSLTPRYYPHRMADDIRRMRDIGYQGVLAEDITAWPTVGPLYYVASKLWWNPDREVDALIDEFHATLYGPAAAPMAAYWDRHEKVWLKKRPGRWFEALGDLPYEAAMYSDEDLEFLDRQFVEAYRFAGDDDRIRQRIRFFEGGWTLAGHYIREFKLLDRMQAAKAPEATAEAARELLDVIHGRRAYWAAYRDEPRFPGQEKEPCEDYRYIIDSLGRLNTESTERSVLSQIGLRLYEEARETHHALVEYYEAHAGESDGLLVQSLQSAAVLELMQTTPNLVQNPMFQGEDQWRAHEPTGGNFWVADGTARIEGADAGLWSQTFPVEPGERLIGAVEYRLPEDPPTFAGLSVSWKDVTGSFLSNYQTVGFDARDLPRADKWQKVVFDHVVPDGAATVLYHFGAWRLKSGQQAEFRKPYLGKVAASPNSAGE